LKRPARSARSYEPKYRTAAAWSAEPSVKASPAFTAAQLLAPPATNWVTNGGTLFAMSYFGAERVVTSYNVMGPVKAALEAACRYLAYELGPKDIRVHAISPGPLKTRAASGLKDFQRLLNDAVERAPLHELVGIEDVGSACAYLASDYARRITGGTIYIDGGAHIVA